MTLTKPYEATFQVGDGETKDFPFLFDEVSENFIRVIIKRADGSIYYPTFSVDMELLRVVFGEDEITPTADDVICIYRDTPTIQDTQFNTLQGYNAKALENILSKIVAMIQEMKANGFSTQILQGEPWSLDLIKPADDGASVIIDYQARVLKKGLYFKMSDGNLLASADGVNFVQMPKSENVAEFRQRADDRGNIYFEYRVGNKWFGLATSADIADTYTKAEVDNKFTVANAQIDANADAIQKTRDDMNAEDSRLQTQITAHAGAITALQNEQTATGNQIQAIESKIPDGTSGTNPLINKQQLLDEEMDIRDDLNEGLSKLQTQITAQATEIAGKQDQLIAGDNITIVDNVISATGGGGGGGIANVIHDATLTGSGTNASPLGLAEAVKDEIASKAPTATVDALTAIVNDILTTYLKKTGDTMTGALNVPEFTVSTAEGTLSISVVAGVPVIASNNGMVIASRVKFNYTPTTDDSTTYADALDVSLMRKAQVSTAISQAVADIDSQFVETVGYVDNIARQLKNNDDQLDANIQTVANWVNAKDTDGNRATLETEAKDAYRAINELNAKISTGGGTKIIIKRYP